MAIGAEEPRRKLPPEIHLLPRSWLMGGRLATCGHVDDAQHELNWNADVDQVTSCVEIEVRNCLELLPANRRVKLHLQPNRNLRSILLEGALGHNVHPRCPLRKKEGDQLRGFKIVQENRIALLEALESREILLFQSNQAVTEVLVL